ncbi:hypothetical protein PoB_005500900 [Plakobranchus ocellatus]|uniref:Uncharacterized protein n=1 Tax=Plakobranchus ocellatus TaxID=259542 RepID=A0AAV4C7H9_9GAST|nr:hypothetical protein PoB_005500900 [Plakobranchus ocellatus]
MCHASNSTHQVRWLMIQLHRNVFQAECRWQRGKRNTEIRADFKVGLFTTGSQTVSRTITERNKKEEEEGEVREEVEEEGEGGKGGGVGGRQKNKDKKNQINNKDKKSSRTKEKKKEKKSNVFVKSKEVAIAVNEF